MKKQLRMLLTALFALVGMTSWAETHVWDPAALTDGTIIALQCRDTNGGSNTFFNGGDVKNSPLAYKNLFRVVANGAKIKLQRLSDGKYVSGAKPVTMVDADASNVASFRVVNEQATGWTTTTEGTDQTKTLRFYLNDSNDKLNAQGAGSVPTYVAGTGGYSIWYVYTFTEEEAEGMTLVGGYNELLAQAQEMIDFLKSTESGEKWVTLITDAANISSPKTEPASNEPGTSIACLIDGNPKTYWHSMWSQGVCSSDNSLHYLEFDFGKAYSNLQMQYQRRQGVANDHPTRFLITASNDGQTFEEIKTIEVTGDGDAVRHTWNIKNETAYRYVRVRATMTDNWRGYWHASEMNFYVYEYFEGPNLYTKAGNVATDVEAILANPATLPTRADIANLQSLYDQLYNLVHAIDAYRNISARANMYGGLHATAEQLAALAEAIKNYDADAAKAIADAMPAVDNARTAFTLTCERSPLYAAQKADGQYVVSARHNGLDLVLEEGSAFGKWAFVDFAGGKYLYNLGAQLFLNNNMIMTAVPTADAIAVVESGNAEYPFMVKSGDLYINVSNRVLDYPEYETGLIINSWSTKDGGNQFMIAVAGEFDPAEAVEVIVFGQAQADMERLEDLQADLTQYIQGKELYISADVRQAIETVMGEAWGMAIYGAAQDAIENGVAYVSPDIWDTLATQIAWIKQQIEAVVNGEVAMFTSEEVSVGFDAELDEQGAPNIGGAKAATKVEVFADRVVVYNFFGIEGCNLNCAYWYDEDLDEYAVSALAVEGDEAAVAAATLDEDDNFGIGSTLTIGEQTLTFAGGKLDPSADGYLTLAFAEGYVKYVWGEYNATAVSAVRAANGQRAYNLAGQRVAKPANGLYIINGTKAVVK